MGELHQYEVTVGARTTRMKLTERDAAALYPGQARRLDVPELVPVKKVSATRNKGRRAANKAEADD